LKPKPLNTASLIENASDNLRARCGIAQESPLLIAVSGGADSMSLLHVICSIRNSTGWKGRIGVAHFNHQLRIRASGADERLVHRVAAERDLPCFVDRGDVRARARQSGISIEMAARELRLAFLRRVAEAEGFGWILTAHHADDQAELLLIRAARGSGSTGLAGMRWSNWVPGSGTVRFARPFLNIPKAQLLRFARKHGIRFREDRSNASGEHLRNRIRHRVMPEWIHATSPACTANVVRSMGILADESDALESIARRWLSRGTSLAGFQRLLPAIQRQVIRLQLLDEGLEHDWDAVEHLRLSPCNPVCLPGGVRVAFNVSMQLERKPDTAVEMTFSEAQYSCELKRPQGAILLKGREVKWRILSVRGLTGLTMRERGEEVFDADAVGSAVLFRRWLPGDVFQPIGLKKATKLQDLFTNAKVPTAERRRRWLGLDALGRVFWVEGLRMSELHKLRPTTRQALFLQAV